MLTIILPQILGFLLGGGLKSKSSIYIQKIFPCEFLRKKLIIQVYFSYLIRYLLVYTPYYLINNLNYKILPMKKTVYKRQFRELTDETKNKISHSLKGRHLTPQHRNAIANSLKNYWSTVKSKFEAEK